MSFLPEQGILKQIPRPIIVYESQISLDTTFIVAELLKKQFQSQDESCILILCGEGFAHYNLVMLKLGINLIQLIKNGKIKYQQMIKLKNFLRVIDFFSQGVSYLVDEIPMTESLPKLWQEQINDSKVFELGDMIEIIKNEITNFNKGNQVQIIVDDFLSMLILLKDQMKKEQTLQSRYLQLIETLRELQGSSTQLHIVGQKVVAIDGFLQIYEKGWRIIKKHSSVQIYLLQNESGFSKDIDGQIIVDLMFDQRLMRKKIIFKVDNGGFRQLN